MAQNCLFITLVRVLRCLFEYSGSVGGDEARSEVGQTRVFAASLASGRRRASGEVSLLEGNSSLENSVAQWIVAPPWERKTDLGRIHQSRCLGQSRPDASKPYSKGDQSLSASCVSRRMVGFRLI